MRRLLLLLVLTGVAALPAAPASASTAAAKRCGQVDIGYTNAKVFGHRVTCHFARVLVRRWLRTVRRRDCDEGNDFCKVTRVRRWRCVRGGSDAVVRLRCRAGAKRVSAVWGD